MESFNEKIEKYFKENNTPIIHYLEIIKNKPAIGEGGFGKVYSGIYNNKQIALKKMKFDTEDDLILKIIQNEIKTMNLASEVCDNVPKFYGLWKGKKSVGLVIELIEGKPLSGLINTLSKEEKIRIVIQLCEILVAIHSKNMIHRDLKPDNIIITKELKVYLIDFGICRIAERVITKTMKPKGTPHYIAPETIDIVEEGDSEEYAFSISTKADIWSLGVIISELFSGVFPWSTIAKNPLHINLLIIQRREFPISVAIDSDIRGIITKCVNYEIDERPNAREIIEEFKKIN